MEELSDSIKDDLENWTVLVGRVSGHWNRADLKIQSYSPVEDRFAVGKTIAVDWQGGKRLLKIRASRAQGHAWICDCDLSPADAQAMKGAQLWIHLSMRPELPEGEFYFDELLGMQVQTHSGRELGQIEEILESKAHPIYVTAQAMFPGVPELIVSTDFAAKLLIVRDEAVAE